MALLASLQRLGLSRGKGAFLLFLLLYFPCVQFDSAYIY